MELSTAPRIPRVTLLSIATASMLLGGAWANGGSGHAPPTALLNFLRVGAAHVALTSGTFIVHGSAAKLEQSTFEDVFRMLKPATVNGRGDASLALNWVCYRLGGDVSTSLILESDEMGGGTYIDGFEMVPAGSRPDLERDCVALDVSSSDLETDKGIRLGLTR